MHYPQPSALMCPCSLSICLCNLETSAQIIGTRFISLYDCLLLIENSFMGLEFYQLWNPASSAQRAGSERRIVFCAMLILIYVRVWSLTMKMYGRSPASQPWPGERVRLNLEQFTVSFSKDVCSQEAVNWVFLGLFH